MQGVAHSRLTNLCTDETPKPSPSDCPCVVLLAAASNSDGNICDAVLLVDALEDACNDLVGANFVTSLKAFA